VATYTFYDNAGQVIETITGYNVATNDSTNNVTTIYNSAATQATSTVSQYSGTTSPVLQGTTTSVYGTTVGNSDSDPYLHSNALLRATIGPDSTNTVVDGGFADGAGGYNRVEYTYRRF
jgi:hypothetical protein